MELLSVELRKTGRKIEVARLEVHLPTVEAKYTSVLWIIQGNARPFKICGCQKCPAMRIRFGGKENTRRRK